MTIKIIGEVPSTERFITGLHSFDRAFINFEGHIGFPTGHGVEIYGPQHCGKTTITQGLAGILAKPKKENIAIVDFEGCDPKLLTSIVETVGFDGTINFIMKDTDEDTLDALVKALREESYMIGILDSIGAISPISEAQGDVGDARMGQRAKIMAVFIRKIMKLLRDSRQNGIYKTLFMINHQYPRISGLGMTTPGGQVKNYISIVRMQVKRMRRKNKYEEFSDGSYIIQGKVIKNRFGLKDKEFGLFVLSGKGIHYGLTAMYDCVMLDLATKGNVIKIGNKSYGRLKKMIEEAHAGNDDFFQPFIDLLYVNTYPLPKEGSTNDGNKEKNENNV